MTLVAGGAAVKHRPVITNTNTEYLRGKKNDISYNRKLEQYLFSVGRY